jgi:2-amino-4-hydroxy-6-hydroxymethyldihydropteridine diphosphokinase
MKSIAVLHEAVLLLGSNLGNKKEHLDTAIAKLEKSAAGVFKISGFYETEAWGHTGQPSFVNVLVMLSTLLSAKELLHHTQQIEKEMGRTRMVKWENRIIDIDILFYDDDIIHEPLLQIPHPAIAARKFALLPLAEMLPDFVHPVLKKTMKQLLAACTDAGKVEKLEQHGA